MFDPFIMSNMITDWLTAIGTIGAVAIALFRYWWIHPNLNISMRASYPDCNKIDDNKYWLRVLTDNSGNKGAEKVEIFAKELITLDEKANSELRTIFYPGRLLWSHIDEPLYGVISPGIPKHCDLAMIIKDRGLLENENLKMISAEKTAICFKIEVQKSDIYPKGYKFYPLSPGRYQIKLLIGATNIKKSISKTIDIDYKMWSDGEKEMLSDNIKIRILPK